jgi:hypothetical protein
MAKTSDEINKTLFKPQHHSITAYGMLDFNQKAFFSYLIHSQLINVTILEPDTTKVSELQFSRSTFSYIDQQRLTM